MKSSKGYVIGVVSGISKIHSESNSQQRNTDVGASECGELCPVFQQIAYLKAIYITVIEF
jgi:hypothetical protein